MTREPTQSLQLTQGAEDIDEDNENSDGRVE